MIHACTFNPYDWNDLVKTGEFIEHMKTVVGPVAVPVVPTSFPMPDYEPLPFLDVGATREIVLAFLHGLKYHPRLSSQIWPTILHAIDNGGVYSREAAVHFSGSAGKLHKHSVPTIAAWEKAGGTAVVQGSHKTYPVVPYYPTDGLKVRATAFQLQPQIMAVVNTIGGASWEIDLLV